MNVGKKLRVILIITALIVLVISIAFSIYLLFSNHQNVQLLKNAESNISHGDEASLSLAEAQLLQLISNDSDNERAFILLGKIAAMKKVYPEQLYYTFKAHQLNPLSDENEQAYIESLLFAREFPRLENFLSRKRGLARDRVIFLLYAAGKNGTFNKYSRIHKQLQNNPAALAKLTEMLFLAKNPPDENKLLSLKQQSADDKFIQQEISAALVDVYLQKNNFDLAEKQLQEACELNEYAFSIALGRFYANFRSLGKAVEVFEKYLDFYHDPMVSLQYAELCCLLKKRDKIADIRRRYQTDSGERAMLLSYYFEALDRFAANDIKALRQYLVPLQKAINTPLATFIYLNTELDNSNLSGIFKYYNQLISQESYLDLQLRADELVLNFIKSNLKTPLHKEVLFQTLAEKVYWRKPDALAGKFILLSSRSKSNFNLLLLTDLLNRFPQDHGVVKFAIEYYLKKDPAIAGNLIASFKTKFPAQKKEMLFYEIYLAANQNDDEKISTLFRKNFSPEIAARYWQFAIARNRTADLKQIAQIPLYKPFCEAAILLKEGKKESALDMLTHADAQQNFALLFYAASTLGENNRIQAALDQYAKFPENSPYKIEVLMNKAELLCEKGNMAEALRLSRQAYEAAPNRPETQYCYADKLHRTGQFARLTEIMTLSDRSPFREKMKYFLISALEHQLKNSDPQKTPDRVLNLYERLLRISPDNQIAIEYREKLKRRSVPNGKKVLP